MATPTNAPVRTADLTVGVIINMDEAIYMLSPMDTPLLTGMGADGLSVIGAKPVDEIIFSWMHDTILTPRSKVAAVVTTDTVITLTAGDRTKFSTGDVIAIGKQGDTNVEIIRVASYGTTADTLVVTRAWSGTATTYASDSIVMGVGTALPEGDDPESARKVDRSELSNVTQIFGPTLVRLSGTEQVVRKYGVASEFSHQLAGRIAENAISREQAFLKGRKVNSTTNSIRTTGGIASMITTNVDSTSTQLTVATIQTNQQSSYNQGGVVDRILASPIGLSDLNDITNTSIVRVDIEEAKRGRQRVQSVETEFGSLTIVRNRWMPQAEAYGIKRDGVSRRVLRPLQVERLAKTGDSDQAQLVCEEGLQLKGEKHMFKMINLAYSGQV